MSHLDVNAIYFCCTRLKNAPYDKEVTFEKNYDDKVKAFMTSNRWDKFDVEIKYCPWCGSKISELEIKPVRYR